MASRYDTIALTQSTGGGQSWSPLVRINPGSDAGARVDDRQAFTPAVHVGDEGTVTVTFYDFRNNTAADGVFATDQWAVHCHPASEDCSRSAGWNEETRVTPASFDMRRAPFAGGHFTGDYEGLGFARSDGDAVGPASDVFVSYFSQPHGGDPCGRLGRGRCAGGGHRVRQDDRRARPADRERAAGSARSRARRRAAGRPPVGCRATGSRRGRRGRRR